MPQQVSQKRSLTVDTGLGLLKFGAAARGKSINCGDGFSIRTAKIKFADGTTHSGFVTICDMDSGELYGAAIYLADTNDITEQSDDDFLAKLGRSDEEVFPYRYKYHGTIACDHHVGADGWST